MVQYVEKEGHYFGSVDEKEGHYFDSVDEKEGHYFGSVCGEGGPLLWFSR